MIPSPGASQPIGRNQALGRSGSIALAIALALAAYLAFSPALFNDGDTIWHLVAGKLILTTGSVPDTDPFSYTFAGRPWVAHEWLAEVFMAWAQYLGGWAGVAIFYAACGGGLLLIIGTELTRWWAPRHVLLVLLAVALTLAPAFLARPHMLGWLLLAGWMLLLLRAREAHRAPPLLAAFLMTIWANVHGSFMLGFVLAGLFALEALVQDQDRARTFREWLTFGVLSLACALLTPHGIHGLLFPFQLNAMESLTLVYEWRPTDPAEDWLFLAMLGATALFLLIRRPRMTVFRYALLALLAYLSIAHIRHQALFAILAAMLLAKPLSAKEGPDENPRGMVTFLAVFALGLLLIGAVRLSVPMSPKDGASQPVTAIARVPAALRDQPVFNTYAFGGSLIGAGIRPYIDGRVDMYGDAFKFEHHRIVKGDIGGFERAAARWGIRWTILARDEPLVDALDRHPGWRRIYADKWAVLHTRK